MPPKFWVAKEGPALSSKLNLEDWFCAKTFVAINVNINSADILNDLIVLCFKGLSFLNSPQGTPDIQSLEKKPDERVIIKDKRDYCLMSSL